MLTCSPRKRSPAACACSCSRNTRRTGRGPAQNEWFFLYTVKISNEGAEPVQLVTRHWIITDGTGHVEEVRGPGVVGKQPTLKPGESFEYTSGCPLPTPFGVMEGTYQMVSESGEHVRREDRAVHAQRAVHRALISRQPQPSS